MDDTVLNYAELMFESWFAVNEIVWVDDGSGTPWLAQIWRCAENGKLDFRPLPTVKLPAPPVSRGE